MPLADLSTIDVLWIVLSAFLVVVGLALAFLLLRLSGTARRLTLLLQGVEASILPLVTRLQGTIDRVNHQLDKADVVTTSAIDAVDAADTAIRAVSVAVTRPVEKISGLARGTVVGVSTFFSGASAGDAVKAARDAKAQREQEISDELHRPGAAAGTPAVVAGDSTAPAGAGTSAGATPSPAAGAGSASGAGTSPATVPGAGTGASPTSGPATGARAADGG